MKSKSLPERVAIIEFDSSHDECLLTQINALKKRGCWVLLITNDLVRSRNLHLEDLVDEWSGISQHGGNLTGTAIGDAMVIRRIMRFLKKREIDKLIFNTAQGGHVRNACLFSLFRKMEFIGVVHTIRKFQGSFTQRIINLKIKKYFVLAEFLQEQIPPHKGIKFETFYPVDFPTGDHIAEKNDGLHISIIGSVESRRKDLEGFISLVQQCDSTVQFSFLGMADPESSDAIILKEKLDKADCLKRVEFFDNRVGFNKIDRILRKTDAILPLVHPDTPSANEYFRNQIPGAMNMALSYQVPLLMHQSSRKLEELAPASIYYELADFSSALEKLKSEEKSIREKINHTKKYSSEYQQNKYLDFLFD